jgi:hypothetical protein
VLRTKTADVNPGSELGNDLKEMFLVANVYRHGDGPSATELKNLHPAAGYTLRRNTSIYCPRTAKTANTPAATG